jgi:hypothetical protein
LYAERCNVSAIVGVNVDTKELIGDDLKMAE